MATHNHIHILGYLLEDPRIINAGSEGAEKALFNVRTIRRELDSYYGNKFQDVVVYYDSPEMMEKTKRLRQFDMIEMQGVFDVLSVNKRSKCPNCGAVNVKERGTASYVYPLSMIKLNSLHEAFERDEKLPERMLQKYEEQSNKVYMIGRIVNDPELRDVQTPYKHTVKCCRYRIAVDRKYFIKTQSDIKTDYPWVYSYGQQAEDDYRYLRKNSVVLIDGFIQNRLDPSTMTCKACGKSYQYPDAEAEFVPYSVEYLQGYLTEAEASIAEKTLQEKAVAEARNNIFTS